MFSLGVPGGKGGGGLRRCLRPREWLWRWWRWQRWSRSWEVRWSWLGGRFFARERCLGADVGEVSISAGDGRERSGLRDICCNPAAIIPLIALRYIQPTAE